MRFWPVLLKQKKRRDSMTKSFFFYGVYEGNEGDETWKVLHEHFEKLKKEDKVVEVEFSDRKSKKRD